MLVNKSGRMLVVGRIHAKNGEALPGIPFTADERGIVEKFVKKGYIVEVEEPKAEPAAEEPKAEPVDEPKVEAAVEEPKAEPVAEEPKVEEPKAEPVEEPKAEAKPTYARYSRRRKKAEVEEQVTEDGGRADG